MNTKIPAAIVCETRVNEIEGGEICIKNEKFGDSINFSTGDAGIARLIGGARYDTANASLIVGVGEYVGFGAYVLIRLYRTAEGKFFRLNLYKVNEGIHADMQPIEDGQGVLNLAKALVPESRLIEFLSEWYCSGLLPFDDEFVREWAESVLPADQCEAILIHLGTRHWRPVTPAEV